MTSSLALKLLVTLMMIFQTTAIAKSRSRGRSDRQSDHIMSYKSNIGRCPTKCTLDQITARLWKQIDGMHVEESYPENCETKCNKLCLQSQDPSNTKRISFQCGSEGDICNYEQNSDCPRHTLEVDLNKALPWPYYDGVLAGKMFLPTIPAATKFSDAKCPVCMKPDLSRLDCMEDVGRMEKCVDEDSCWIFPLSETVIVPIREGVQVEINKIVKCFQDALLQTGEGCKHDKCTGDVYRADEESGTMFSSKVLSTTVQETGTTSRRGIKTELYTTSPREVETRISTDSTATRQIEGETLISTDSTATRQIEGETLISTDSTASRRREGENLISTDSTASRRREGETRISTDFPTGPTTETWETSRVIITTKQPTFKNEVDATERKVTDHADFEGMCTELVQNCPAQEKCFGRKMEDGRVEYICSALQNLDCTMDEGCSSTCMPPYIPCIVPTVSPTNKPIVTDDSINESEEDPDYSNEVAREEAVYVVNPDENSDESAATSTVLTASLLIFLACSVIIGLLH